MNSSFISPAKIAFLIVTFASLPAIAQEDRLIKWRNEIELQSKAERHVSASRALAATRQHGMDRLDGRKAQLEKEMAYIRAKFDGTVRQLKASQELGADPGLTDRFDREAAGWELRRKAVENDLKKIDAESRTWQSLFPAAEKQRPWWEHTMSSCLYRSDKWD